MGPLLSSSFLASVALLAIDSEVYRAYLGRDECRRMSGVSALRMAWWFAGIGVCMCYCLGFLAVALVIIVMERELE